MIRNIDYDDGDDNWDAPERRTHNPGRRQYDQVIIEHSVPKAEPKFNFWTNGPLLGASLTVLLTVGGFIFNLYNKATELDYKQAAIFEKIADIKATDLELKIELKSHAEQLRSLEESLSAALRQK